MGKEAGTPMDSAEFEARLTAQNGGQILKAADSVTAKDYSGILIINDTVLASLTCTGITGASNLASITLPAGLYIPGNFSELSVTSGVLLAINR